MDFVTQFTISKEEGSQVKITGEIPFVELEKQREKAIKHLGKDMDIAGFRKGNIPAKMIIAQVGEMAVLNEMAERALSLAYPQALRHHIIEAIGLQLRSLFRVLVQEESAFFEKQYLEVPQYLQKCVPQRIFQ